MLSGKKLKEQQHKYLYLLRDCDANRKPGGIIIMIKKIISLQVTTNYHLRFHYENMEMHFCVLIQQNPTLTVYSHSDVP